MNGYEKDIRLEKKFASKIKQILGEVFITQDPILDRQEATDFLIFTVNISKVAARLRTYKHYTTEDRKNEFTIRYSRPSGNPTEIDKIREGKVGYIFYGFANSDETKIIHWFIGDLDVFRKNESPKVRPYPNDPPDSEFVAYKIKQFPKSFIVARGGKGNQQALIEVP